MVSTALFTRSNSGNGLILSVLTGGGRTKRAPAEGNVTLPVRSRRHLRLSIYLVSTGRGIKFCRCLRLSAGLRFHSCFYCRVHSSLLEATKAITTESYCVLLLARYMLLVGGLDCCYGMCEEKQKASAVTPITSKTSFEHSSLVLRESKEDVFKKYEVMKVLGQGSMGAVCRVRIKTDKIGGSAFVKKGKGGVFGFGLLGRNKGGRETGDTLTERSDSDHLYALKSIILDRVSPVFIQELMNEVDILKSMDHPNIVKAHELYSYKKQLFLVLELCDGGDLYTRSPYSERKSAKHTASLLSAIRYMHENNIVHRDLKVRCL